MTNWRSKGRIWCLWPARPKGLIEVIGGSYLSASPHVSYRRLLEGLYQQNLAIHAWSYLPGFDHQSQANEAWKNLRKCRKDLEIRVGDIPSSIRLGHSLGCKLHLLAPDGGRNSNSLVALSFNNFTSKQSIPLFSEIKPKFGILREFNPTPEETIELISQRYIQPKNLLIRFKEDNLDETTKLLCCLKQREGKDNSSIVNMVGDHLTPVSFGLRQNLLGKWSNDHRKRVCINQLITEINNWSMQTS